MAAQLTEVSRTLLGRVLAIINGKGGVLKTTLTSNVACLSALSGQRVLAIDLDPQGNLEDDLGYANDSRNDRGQSLAKALMFGGSVDGIVNVRDNVDVWVGGEELQHAAAALNAMMGKNPTQAKLALARVLEPVAADYDLIIIDCPPGDGPLQQAALAAARWALVPTKTDDSSIKGLQTIAARFDDVLDVNRTLDLLGVVLTGVGTPATNKKTNELILRQAERGARADIAEMFGVEDGIVFGQTVRHSEAVARDSRKLGMVAHELDQRSKEEVDSGLWWKIRRGEADATKLTARTATSVADDLQEITQELWNRIGAAEATEGASA